MSESCILIAVAGALMAAPPEQLGSSGSRQAFEVLVELGAKLEGQQLSLWDWQPRDRDALALLRDLPPHLTVAVTLRWATDADLRHFRGLKKLKKLDVRLSDVGDTGLEHLEGLAALEELDLGGTHITDAGLVHLKTLPQLRRLNLTGTGISDAGMAGVAQLTNLEELDFTHTKFSDAGLAHLAALRRLKKLSLASNKRITGSGLGQLPCDGQLEYLNLRPRKEITYRIGRARRGLIV